MPVLVRSVASRRAIQSLPSRESDDEFVQLGVVALPDDAAGRKIGRGVIHQGPADQVLQFRQPVQVGRHLGHQGRKLLGQQGLQEGHPGQGLFHGPDFPGSGLLQGHPGGEAFQVPQPFQGLAPALAQQAVVLEKLHRVQAGLDLGLIL